MMFSFFSPAKVDSSAVDLQKQVKDLGDRLTKSEKTMMEYLETMRVTLSNLRAEMKRERKMHDKSSQSHGK